MNEFPQGIESRSRPVSERTIGYWTVMVAVITMFVAMTTPKLAATTRVQRQATAGHRHHHTSKKKVKLKGQRAMEPQRVTEIQQALIREHYLQGPANGIWDADSQTAMVKMQAANGWQTKVTPDSRALIKLGLGPKQDAGEYSAANAGLAHSAGGVSTNANSGTNP